MTSGRLSEASRAAWPTRALLVLLALVVALSALPLGSLAPALAQDSAGEEVIVVLDDGADPVAAAREMGVEVRHIYRHVFTGFAGVMTPAEVGTARLRQVVGDISPDGRVQAEFQTIPDGVSRTGIPKEAGTEHLDIPSPVNADIAILDTGVALNADLNVAGGFNCVGSNPDNWQDDQGHGTHVAGIAAAIDNDDDVVGVAPGARVWAVKVLDGDGFGTFGDVICGLDWVVEHADDIDVVNLSLSGIGDKGNCNQPAFHKAVCAVVNAGIPVAVAAGNQGAKASTRIPASYPEVITVSAFGDSDGQPGGDGPRTCFGTEDDRFLRFSNYGAAVDIAAPGACILSLFYQGGTEEITGTSEAAPHVAGALADFIADTIADTGSRPTASQSRTWLLTEGSRPQSEDGVTGDRDLEKHKKKDKKNKKKNKKGGKGNKNGHKNDKKKNHKKKKNKNKHKGAELREPVLWLESLGEP